MNDNPKKEIWSGQWDKQAIDGVDSCMTVKFADTNMVLYQPTPAVTHPPCSKTLDLHEIKGQASISSKHCQGDLSSPEELSQSTQLTWMSRSNASEAAEPPLPSLLSCLAEGCVSTVTSSPLQSSFLHHAHTPPQAHYHASSSSCQDSGLSSPWQIQLPLT